MKNTPYILFLLLLQSPFSQAQVERYAYGDTISVWASSLHLRESPEARSKLKGRILYGSTVVIVDDSIGQVPYKYKAVGAQLLPDGGKSKPFSLSGFWVKVNFNGTVGYVFDGYLSKTPTFSNGIEELPELKVWAIRNLKLKAHPYKKGDDEWVSYSDKHTGIEVRIGHNEKTSFREIILQNATMEEALMLGIQIFRAQYLIGIHNGEYEFESFIAEPDCSIFISKVKDKIVISLSCHC